LVTSGRIGNPDLVSERSFSYELGADYMLDNSLKLSATYFRRQHDDLIDYISTPYSEMPRKNNLSPTGSYALAQNISKVHTKGLELDILFWRKFSNDYSLWSSAGLLWLQSNSSSATPSFYVSSHARFLSNFNVILQAPRFSISTNGIYKLRDAQAASAINAKVSKDYFVLNAKAEVFIWKRKLGLVAQADNIFNRNYSDLLGAIMPQRWLMGGIKVSL
jgi:iron complex outermembrane receptor protein